MEMRDLFPSITRTNFVFSSKKKRDISVHKWFEGISNNLFIAH